MRLLGSVLAICTIVRSVCSGDNQPGRRFNLHNIVATQTLGVADIALFSASGAAHVP